MVESPRCHNDTPAHRELALKTARESLVLLKNENHFLPLKKIYPKIAVIGPDADSLDALEGNYNGTPSVPVTILAGLQKRFPFRDSLCTGHRSDWNCCEARARRVVVHRQ